MNNPENNLHNLKEIEIKLKQFEINEWEKAKIRVRNINKNDGEKNSKFFLHLENQQTNHNRFQKIKDIHGNYIDQPGPMIQCINSFYEELYTSDNINGDQMQTILNEIKTNLFDDNKVKTLVKDIDEVELRQALYQMKTGKSPGIDGLTVEFYRTFWNTLKYDLIDVIKECNNCMHLPNSMNTALIRLIYKNKGCKEDVRNWRPISLLRVYKLISKVITNRLKIIMPDIIGEN